MKLKCKLCGWIEPDDLSGETFFDHFLEEHEGELLDYIKEKYGEWVEG